MATDNRLAREAGTTLTAEKDPLWCGLENAGGVGRHRLAVRVL